MPNLYVDQGITFAARMVVHHENDDPVDLVYAKIGARFRKSVSSPVVYNFNVEKEDAANGTIILRLSKELTTALSAGRYVYSVDYTIDDECVAITQGQVVVSPRVTQ